MSDQHSSPEVLVVAIITVGVASQTVDQIVQVVDKLPWAPAYQHLDKYIANSSRPQWATSVKSADSCVAIVDFEQNAEAAIATVEALQHVFAGKISIIALSRGANPAMILSAMRAGCGEYLEQPFSTAQLLEALSRFGRRSAPAGSDAKVPGKVLSFFGAKGGVGTTTLAVHLASYLVQCHTKKTLLIDNRSELGHVCLYLGLEEKQYNFRELIRNVNRLDGDLLQGFVIHHSSGLHVLSSPDEHGDTHSVDPDALEETVFFLRQEYDYILLDGDASFQEASLAVFDSSDLVYLIATPEIGAIRDLSRYVDGVLKNDHTTEKLRVVMNRCESKDAMNTVQVEKAIRLPLSIKIQNSYGELVKAINTGQPVPPSKSSRFSMQMQHWGRDVVGDTLRGSVAPDKKRFAFWK